MGRKKIPDPASPVVEFSSEEYSWHADVVLAGRAGTASCALAGEDSEASEPLAWAVAVEVRVVVETGGAGEPTVDAEEAAVVAAGVDDDAVEGVGELATVEVGVVTALVEVERCMSIQMMMKARSNTIMRIATGSTRESVRPPLAGTEEPARYGCCAPQYDGADDFSRGADVRASASGKSAARVSSSWTMASCFFLRSMCAAQDLGRLVPWHP